MFNQKELLDYIIAWLKNSGCKNEVHSFPSGANMIDIWIREKFYVIHLEEKTIGLSEIKDENISFDNNPDRSFTNPIEFKTAFESIF